MGEYAKRISDGQEIKLGTCENMYYIRLEDWGKIEGYPYTYKGLTFRVPVPSEDDIKPGEYPSCFNIDTKLIRTDLDEEGRGIDYIYYSGDECTLDHPGIIQMKHESGLLLNVPCYHGQQLPETIGEIKAFWNGKTSDVWRLTGIKVTNEDTVKFIISCRFCNKSFNCDFEEIADYIQRDQVLFKRLNEYNELFNKNKATA